MNKQMKAGIGKDGLGSGIREQTPDIKRITGLTLEDVVARFEAAGATLMALPGRGYSTQMRTMRFDVVHSALDAYGWQGAALRPPMPSAAAISQMEDVFGWLTLIPEGKYVLRRIVGARALVHPITLRHIYPWRRLGGLLGADHKSVQRWHRQAVTLIRDALHAEVKFL